MGPAERVIILIDMDCFYCQVEEKLDSNLKGKPIAVVQYNAWRGGGIIAVNYPARDQGVTRHMRGNDAKKKCPSINLVRVPQVRGKADLTKYRDAGKRVADVLATFTPLLERASVDEAYLDITEAVKKRIEMNLSDLTLENMQNTFVVGHETKDFVDVAISNKEFSENNLMLAVGGLICEEIRREVYNKTGYKCSAGIAHNKILAKLVCSLHKPNKQTILPQEAVDRFFETMPISKIKNLGGKFGQTLSEGLGITFMGQLKKFTEKELSQRYDEKTGNWLYNIARGIDVEPVTTKLVPKSIACCKNFQGKAALTSAESVQHWLGEFAEEMSERLQKDFEEHNRKAKQMIVSFTQQEIGRKDVSGSRTHSLSSYDPKKIASAAFEVIKKNCLRTDGSYHLKYMGLSAGHFEDVKNVREITSFFKTGQIQNNTITATKKLLDKTDRSVSFFKTRHGGQETTSGNANGCTIDHRIVSDSSIDKGGNSVTSFFKMDQKQVKTLNKSNYDDQDTVDENVLIEDPDIYAKLTQELDENVEDLIFYDDHFRLKESNDEHDSHETNGTFENDKTENHNQSPVLPSSSFFRQYFVQTPINNSPGEKILQENDYNKQEELTEICPECNKTIQKSEMLSHRDYHFAINLMKSDKESRKATPKTEIKKNSKSGTKRKIVGSGDLTTFFQKESDLSTEFTGTEVCPECNKRIKIDEIPSHQDYHMAKKIYSEINSVQPLLKTKVVGKKTSKSKVPSTSRTVTSFFTKQ